MVRAELIKRSPLRILERSMHGGLGAGNIGILASRKGVGKTACLVHIATMRTPPTCITTIYHSMTSESSKKKRHASRLRTHPRGILDTVVAPWYHSVAGGRSWALSSVG